MRTSPRSCRCASEYRVILPRAEEYRRIKAVLNRAKHPTFIGRDLVRRCGRNGGVTLYQYDGRDVAVTVVNPRRHVLLVLSVDRDHQGHGLGAALLEYIRPLWIRSVESATPYFVARGYTPVGEPKHGHALTTNILARRELFSLAGRLQRIKETGCQCDETESTSGSVSRDTATRAPRGGRRRARPASSG